MPLLYRGIFMVPGFCLKLFQLAEEEVGGIEKTDYCIVCSGDYSFSGRFPSFAGVAGHNIGIIARRVVGTAALTTFAAGLPAPSFASSILISSAS